MATRRRRGFAAMDPQKQREIASMGGRAAHEKGTAHEFTSAEASKAGRRGGRAVSRDREYMAEIGRRGGLRSQGEQADATTRGRAAVNGHARTKKNARRPKVAAGGTGRNR
jgi:uncharacterized protein